MNISDITIGQICKYESPPRSMFTYKVIEINLLANHVYTTPYIVIELIGEEIQGGIQHKHDVLEDDLIHFIFEENK